LDEPNILARPSGGYREILCVQIAEKDSPTLVMSSASTSPTISVQNLFMVNSVRFLLVTADSTSAEFVWHWCSGEHEYRPVSFRASS